MRSVRDRILGGLYATAFSEVCTRPDSWRFVRDRILITRLGGVWHHIRRRRGTLKCLMYNLSEKNAEGSHGTA